MKTVLCIAAALLLAGCDGASQEKCFQSIQRTYPNSEIHIIINHPFQFVVKKANGDILFVECMGLSTSAVTFEQKILP